MDALGRGEGPPGLPGPSAEQEGPAVDRTVSPPLSAQKVPDLELLVQERPGSGGRSFDLRLKARDPELDLNYCPAGCIILRSEPGEFFRQQIAEIWKGRPGKAGERTGLTDLLRVKGAYFSETILPRELKDRLSGLRGKVRSLLIQSDDPWIPWEILRVPEVPGGDAADGPFLCEAFALTRWLSGVRQTLSLPIRRIAVVVPRDSGLPQSEGELADLLALARDETRQVERIPARLADLQEVFRQGEHDGWHFTGHGTYRESAPDLSSFWLEEGEELTPVHLSGRERRLGSKRPLVFLNACSSGKSGISLTDLGGWAPHFLKADAGAWIGALWPVEDGPARAFARAFYSSFLAGAPIAEAVYAARQAIRSEESPAWLAYTVFAHPMATCAPAVPSELPARDTTLAYPVFSPSSEPAAKPLWTRRTWIAAAGIVLLLFLATTRTLLDSANRAESRDEASASATKTVEGLPLQTSPAGAALSEKPEPTQEPPASPAAAPPKTTRSMAADPELPSGAMVEGISFRVSAAPGFPKSALERALRSEAARLADAGISGWTLSLEAGAPEITSSDQDGLKSCRLTADCGARGEGRTLDLGPAEAVNAQFNSAVACEEAAKTLAKAAVNLLGSTVKKGAT